MAFFQHHSWQLITKLEIYFGLWPYQAWFKTYFIRVTYLLCAALGFIPIVARLQKELGVNLLIATENISGIELFVGLTVKVVVACVCGKKRQKLYEKVNEHFRTITDPEEAFVLRKSAENAMKFCIKYLIVHCVAIVIFFFLPVAKMFYEYLMNNGELEKIFPYYVDYSIFFDEDKFYPLIILHMVFLTIPFAGMNCACDFPFIMIIRHVSTIFQIVQIRLQQASGFFAEFEWDMMDFKTADKKAYELGTKSIQLHNEAFEMVSLIEDAYNYTLFIVLLESIFIFSGGVYMVLFNINRPFHLLRYFVFDVALFIHLGVQFLHGQIIINSSSSVFDACYNFKCYLASPKTRKLLSIMMLRSSRPCVITGGNLFVISMETFGKMIKIGFSYLSIFTKRMSLRVDVVDV